MGESPTFCGWAPVWWIQTTRASPPVITQCTAHEGWSTRQLSSLRPLAGWCGANNPASGRCAHPSSSAQVGLTRRPALSQDASQSPSSWYSAATTHLASHNDATASVRQDHRSQTYAFSAYHVLDCMPGRIRDPLHSCRTENQRCRQWIGQWLGWC